MTLFIRWIDPRPMRWLATALWMVFFLILLLQPEKNPILNTGIPPGPQSPERDILFTTLHLIGFSITTALWWWALSGHLPSRQAMMLAAMIAISMSFTTEWLQSLTPDRHAQVSDLLANAAGALLIYGYVVAKSKRDR